MSSGLVTISYLVAAVLFILALGGLSRQETARRGNLYGIVGMGLALVGDRLRPRVTAQLRRAGRGHRGSAARSGSCSRGACR